MSDEDRVVVAYTPVGVFVGKMLENGGLDYVVQIINSTTVTAQGPTVFTIALKLGKHIPPLELIDNTFLFELEPESPLYKEWSAAWSGGHPDLSIASHIPRFQN